ncbi:MAG: GntR family transcriptional regulator [Rhodospirillales bacterium]
MRIERPRSLTGLVTDALRQEIVAGDLEPGAALSEAKIASRLEVSRTPVREAFQRLELEGLVRTEPQRGTFVFTLTHKQLTDICDLRVCLESHALAQSLTHDRAGLSAALTEKVEAMAAARAAGDDRRYLQLDTAFHQVFFDHADNAFLNEAYQTIAAKMAALRNRLGAHADHMAKSFAEHGRIATLVGQGKLAPATKILVAHIGRKDGSYWNL